MKEACGFLNNYLHNGDTIILGCSGGPDSMCLLSLLAENHNYNVVVAHVNHKVRQESDAEYIELQKYCNDNNIVFEGLILDKLEGNFESEARKRRYAFFEELYNKYNAKCIMTAHHGDDLIETVLMRITRGSNLSGYAGLKLIDGHYVRPLLYVTKEDIIKYNQDENICYFNDYTNDLDEHTRNRYRHTVLPFLKSENKLVHLKYLKYSEELSSYDEFVTKYINDLNIINNHSVDLTLFNKQDNFVKRKIIELIIKDYQKDYYFDVSDKNVDDVLELANSNKSNVSISLPNHFKATKSYNNLHIEYENNIEKFHIIFKDKYEDDDWIISRIKFSEDDSNYTIRLDSNEISMPIHIRNRKDGDKMLLNVGTKKIKDVFIDSKVSITERDRMPLIVDNSGNVLLIPGIKKSKFAKDKDEKYDIILKCERKNKNE